MVGISSKNLIAAALIIGALLLIFIGLFATGMIGGLVVGTISETSTSGVVPVSTAMNTSLAGLEGDYITASEALFGNVTLIIGLFAIVVIIMVFGFKMSFGGKGKKGVE